MNRVHTIKCKDDFNKLMERSFHHPVIIDYCAPWCQPCRKIAPIFECLAEDHHNIVFGRMDIECIPEIADGEDVCSLPTFIVYRCGEQKERLSGASETKLRALLRSLC